MKPQRIQRKRTKGWRMPENTLYVGRPTKWGNPYTVSNDPFIITPADAVQTFRWFLDYHIHGEKLMNEIQELRGKNLACFCPLNQPCHADILLEKAND